MVWEKFPWCGPMVLLRVKVQVKFLCQQDLETKYQNVNQRSSVQQLKLVTRSIKDKTQGPEIPTEWINCPTPTKTKWWTILLLGGVPAF